MAKQRANSGKKEIKLDFGEVSDKQQQFLDADTFFVCYGGAKGGGKSHISRLKAVGMCMYYPGIRILMIRCHYPELEENLVRPILKWVPNEIYSYNGTSHLMTFDNGSIIKFGHYDGDASENEYQGVEYDVIFIDEATQLSERAFRYLQGCIRGVNDFPKRMYLTCNPGGIGHRWVKRLFIDKNYIVDEEHPEKTEHAENYTFIFATVEDNKWLMESSPFYLQNLSNMPEEMVQAFRYGDWNALSGAYFKNFSRASHTVAPFKIPSHWNLYRSFDYGFDMFSVGWWAVDEDDRSWCIRYYEHKDLVVQDAAAQLLSHSLPNERNVITYAPPDMWSRTKDSGKMVAELFAMNGVPLFKSSNNRAQGHMVMKDMMQPMPIKDPFVKSLFPGKETLPGLMFFNDQDKLIEDIESIQADEKNPNDCATQPHDVTHSVDMCRYYCVSYVAQAEEKKAAALDYDEDDALYEYDDYMRGGEITDQYMDY